MDSAFLYSQLTERLPETNPEIRKVVDAHIAVVTGGKGLEPYHANGAKEEDKVRFYSRVLRCILKEDPRELEDAQPAAAAPAPAPKPAPQPAAVTPPPQPAVVTPPVQPKAQAVAPAVDPKMANLLGALKELLPQPEARVDETRLRQIVTEMICDRMRDERVAMEKLINNILAERLKVTVTVIKD